jgi:hypothetical protein
MLPGVVYHLYVPMAARKAHNSDLSTWRTKPSPSSRLTTVGLLGLVNALSPSIIHLDSTRCLTTMS